MNTRTSFDEYYKANYDRVSLGEAFCNYFNVDVPTLKDEKDDEIAQRQIDAYFESWGVV